MDDLFLLITGLNASVRDVQRRRGAERRAGNDALANRLDAESRRLNRIAADLQWQLNQQVVSSLQATERELAAAIEALRAIGLVELLDATAGAATHVFPQLAGRFRPTAAPGGGPSGPAQDLEAAGTSAPVDAAGDAGQTRAAGLGAPPDAGAAVAAGAAGATPGGNVRGPAAAPAPEGSIVVARATDRQALVQAIIDGARDAGLDPLVVLTVALIESDLRPRVVNRVTKAGGLFQFLNGTWKDEGGPAEPTHEGSCAAAASEAEQIRLGCKFLGKNASALERELGAPPTATALYIAHQHGLTGARRLLTADPTADVTAAIGRSAVQNNLLAGKTVAQALAHFDQVVGAHEDELAQWVDILGPAAPHPAPPAASPAQPRDPAVTVRERAISEALFEMKNYARSPGGRRLAETDEPLNARVLEYFRTVRRPDVARASAEPWSAAFISWVMRRAGATEEEFPFAPNHARYILRALQNRKDGVPKDQAPLFYYDRDEEPPRRGDLIGYTRTGAVSSRADIEARLPRTHFAAHTDLVVEVTGTELTAIGGNVSDTIGLKKVALNAAGRIAAGEKHWFLLRVNI